jgi:hypothetical protein
MYPKSDPRNVAAKLLLNSIYGRFGMDDSFSNIQILNNKNYMKFEKEYSDSIEEVIDFNDSYLVKYRDTKLEFDRDLDNGSKTRNINIAIASAITANARIRMSQFKDPEFLKVNNLKLLYSDTDSAYFNNPLPLSFVDPIRLGAMKLEGVYDEAVFLAPKVYSLKNKEEEIIKIKGLSKNSINKHGINLDLLYQLLIKESYSKFNQTKWFKNLNKGTISVLDQLYTLKVTDNKRKLIYNQDNVLIDTIPLFLVNGTIQEL